LVAYSFNKQFIRPILAGTKQQTIRPDRKRHARVGEEMQLYTAMRTKYCRLIGTATCLGVAPVTIDLPGNIVWVDNNAYQGWEALDAFAQRDGFDGWLMMRAFWIEHHPAVLRFTGVMIVWRHLVIPSASEAA
jgi:hypothetical protein